MTVAELDTRVQDLVGKTGKLLIDGNWVEARLGQDVRDLRPGDRQSLGTVAEGDAEDIDRAVAAARRASTTSARGAG